MADVLDVACPKCKKTLKVPSQFVGKRVKCRGCQEAFEVQTPPGPNPDQQRTTWDEGDDEAAPLKIIQESDIPRCPHCAKELDPPDAIICLNCGFNNRTRVRVETKRVYEATVGEWVSHLFPGVGSFIAIVTILVLNVLVIVSMRYWMRDGLLESDDLGPDGEKKFFVSPGFFIMLSLFVSIGMIAPLVRVWYKRMFVNYLPPEEAMKEKDPG